MSTDLRKSPYNLDEEAVAWVEETIAGMSDEEKVGQLFVNLGRSTDEAYIDELVNKYHIGGARFTETDAAKILKQNETYQRMSRIPMFIAANCEEGGSGASRQGTKVATQAQCGATDSTEAAYELGRIGAKEAAALGCNWIFGPMADIVFNWRNTLVNTRSFGMDADTVLEMTRAALRGAHESNVITAVKHFPGDGVEERDQHLVLGVNDLSVEEWEASFGKVYRTLINEGLESIMVGHFAFPAYTKKCNPNVAPQDILPASLAPELVNGLLRTELGFQGLVITDASHMGGMIGARPRREQVQGAIAAGCDMFLFLHNPAEDIGYMLDGYRNGVITEERMQDALMHILGMKAKLGLHRDRGDFDEKNLAVVGCEEHHSIAAQIADRSITLVKDNEHILPLNPSEKKRARLYYLEMAPMSAADGTDPAKYIVKEELEKAGFTVDLNESYYELEAKEHSPLNKFRIMDKPTVEEFKSRYDVVFVFVNMTGFAQENNVRVKYSAAFSNELPWWTRDVPTVFVSLNYTNHLYDLTMARTYINAYGATRECIRATVEKMVGKSEFCGRYNENVWCGRWDTRL